LIQVFAGSLSGLLDNAPEQRDSYAPSWCGRGRKAAIALLPKASSSLSDQVLVPSSSVFGKKALGIGVAIYPGVVKEKRMMD
jgi:hypothetical protein